MEKEEFVLGELIWIEDLPVERFSTPNGSHNWRYVYNAKYLCFCGKEFITGTYGIKKGRTKSCGCLRTLTKSNLKHGERNTRLYNCWSSMKSRCYNKNNQDYYNYGERGITVCDEWKNNFINFRNWAYSYGYQDNLSIDRSNNEFGYSPNNCKWSNTFEQAQNKRKSFNVKSSSNFKGVTYSKEKGIKKRWKVYVGVNKTKVYIGIFHTENEAAWAYNQAVAKLHKKVGWINDLGNWTPSQDTVNKINTKLNEIERSGNF